MPFKSKSQMRAMFAKCRAGELPESTLREYVEATEAQPGGFAALPETHEVKSAADPRIRTTVGQVLVNDALPPRYRDYTRRLDKAGLKAFLQGVAKSNPEDYEEVTHALLQVGARVAHNDGMSIGLSDVQSPKEKKALAHELRTKIDDVMLDGKLTDEQKEAKVLQLSNVYLPKIDALATDWAKKNHSRVYELANSGIRGGLTNVTQMLGAVGLVQGQKKKPVPFPIISNYSEGLSPAEYFAAAFGVRNGYIDIKLATPKAGYLSKQLSNAAQRLLAGDGDPYPGTGLPVDADDPDNVGSVLARDTGKYPAGTVITPSIMKDLQRTAKRILVHSPLSAIAAEGLIPRAALGITETGEFARSGDAVGIQAAQTVSEPLAQGSISSKHKAGAMGAKREAAPDVGEGFKGVDQLVNIPKTFQGGATVSQLSGRVFSVRQAPQGGHYVDVGGQQHYVSPDIEVKVRANDEVEAGDVLSGGIPNPADIVRHKGIGEGRRYFAQQLRKTLAASGVQARRQHSELLARGIINHVEIGDRPLGDYLPGDIVPYDDLASKYAAREGSSLEPLRNTRGKYLESPVLHYSIGTRITPAVIQELGEFGVNDILVHKEQPGFSPKMIRTIDIPANDPDWMVRMGGFGLQKSTLKAVHSGAKSDLHSTSFIPSLAQGTEFGRSGTAKY